MTDGPVDGRWRLAGRAVVLAAVVVALVGAQPYAGGWNDGSRLATAESLGERGTFVIDDSVFVRVPPETQPTPYPPGRADLLTLGTLDKLQIGGHFYSDKSPVPNVLMAGLYRAWLTLGGPTAGERPDLFCWFLTVASSGLAYIVTVIAIRQLGATVGLSGSTLFLLTVAVAFGTVAPAYSRHVNSHILFLGAAAMMCLGLANRCRKRGWPVVVGTAAGFAYTCDLGVGPVQLVCLAPYCVWAYRGWKPVAIVGLAALPWVVAHHALNYAIAGTLLPANMVPEYLNWPGSPFVGDVMTGSLRHGPGWLALYAADLVIGKKGILLNNIPLWLAPGGAVLLGLRRRELRPALAFCIGWSALTVLLYAATSSNYGGQCCSVRWFVPLIAPGFWVVALTLREYPRYRPDFAWLTGCGVVLGALMWWGGPWAPKMVPGLWGWVAAAGVGWGVVRWRSRGAASAPASGLRPDRYADLTTRSSSAA
ncbi:MAG TPA: hypothetical protein VFG68_05050 [Fimbriiglobus sp.]|nr:hypothetical protein [Fimbriiglobus sp.]